MKNFKILGLMLTIFAAVVFYGAVGDVSAQRRGGSGSLEWRGTVDDTVQIRIRNNDARTRVLNGRDYNDYDFNFSGDQPRRNSTIRVDKNDGRGSVSVIQQPSRGNNFTTIIQIRDPKGGADRLSFHSLLGLTFFNLSKLSGLLIFTQKPAFDFRLNLGLSPTTPKKSNSTF